MKSRFTFVLSMALVLPLSAFKWNSQPPQPAEGLLGENVILEWNFTLVSSNETFDYFALLQNGDDMIKYSHGVGAVIYELFTGRVGMAKNGTPAFMLINLKWSDDGTKFCCKVGITKGSGGKIYKDCVVLKLLVRPRIVAFSRNQTLNESNDVTLSCNATGTPVPNVTWSKSGNENNNFKPGSFLSLRNISREKDGLYWCTVENGAGKAIASVRVIVQFPPSIQYVSHDTTAKETDDVKLFCNSTGNPRPNITWTLLSGSKASTVGTEETLHFSNVSRNQEGTYQCTAANGIMSPKTANVHVTINYSPFIKRLPISQTVNESSVLELFCNATGNPPPYITWSKVADPAVHLSVDEVLKVKNINKTDSGVYQCRASNGIGRDVFASANVTVNYKPIATLLTSNVTQNAVIMNLPVTFHCSADSVPPPVLQLRFKNSALGHFSNGAFTIGQVQASDQGMYECLPSNIIGIGVTATLNLTVIVPPSIEYISHDATFNETDDVKLFCNSTGNPRPTIIWTFLNGSEEKIVRTEETLALYTVKRNQTGIYQCTASNGVMSTKTTASVHVTINYKPEIKEGVQRKIKSWINHETEVTCEAEGFPVPDIIWTRNGNVMSSKTGVREFKFTPVDTNDFGVYVCTATNILGSTKKIITIEELVAPESPEILRIDLGVDNMEIHWQASISNRDSPILDYLAKVKEKDESHEWKNCTRITVQTSSSSLSCVMNDLRSGTMYIVQVAARNVVGYSAFTEVEAQTKKPAVMATTEERKQQLLSGATIDGIIAGVICFCSLVVVIVAIVTQRRPCHLDCRKNKSNKSSEECVNEHHNQAFEESPQTDELNEQV